MDARRRGRLCAARRLFAATSLLIAGLAVGPIGSMRAASANPAAGAKPPKDQALVDLRGERANYTVLTDDDSNIYVVRNVYAGGDERELFFGDGKILYRQRVSGGSADGTTGQLDWSAWSPRTSNGSGQVQRLHDGTYRLDCGQDSSGESIRSTLQPVPIAEADRIFATAQFRTELWTRAGHTLARDDMGTYYYVDRLREAYGSQSRRGHRVFVGKRGAMKQVPLTTVVDDSAGEIFATKRGELRLTADRAGKARWTRGKKTVELVSLPVSDNLYLIYRELGIYGQLGVICEDL